MSRYRFRCAAYRMTFGFERLRCPVKDCVKGGPGLQILMAPLSNQRRSFISNLFPIESQQYVA